MKMNIMVQCRARDAAGAFVLLAVISSPVFGQTTSPSFNCGRAASTVERLICMDPGLARLDRAMADTYRKALKMPGGGAQRSAQRMWIRTREGCAASSNVRECVETAYQYRIAEIQIEAGLLPAPKAVTYDCDNQAASLSAAFYNDTDPPSTVLALGGDRVIAMVLPSGSGARYGVGDVEFWEHQGEAMVSWRGRQLTCKPR